MLARGSVLVSSLALVVACGGDVRPLGERNNQVGPDGGGAGGSGGVSGTSGTGGSGAASGASGGAAGSTSGGAGGAPSACTPTDESCYGNRPPNSPGSECLANVDNTGADVVQFRQTWVRNVLPLGNTTGTVYGVLQARTQLKQPECHASQGNGGHIQLARWDRSNPDVTQQTLTTGYAHYSGSPTGAFDVGDVVRDGLCFADWSYGYDGPPLATPVATSRWPQAQPQPWNAGPVVSQRVAADFVVSDVLDSAPSGGVFYADEAAGYLHGFIPLLHVTLLDNTTSGLMVPLRSVETKQQFNDSSFNCLGRFRADQMAPESNCSAGLDKQNPQWGCLADAQCPPRAGFGPESGPGAAPSYTTAYVLIVDLEQIWSHTLASTLCVSYQAQQRAIDDGWALPTTEPGGWGNNCRGSPKWDPSAPDDQGLPMGDWCSRTNSPATATCHDAFRVEFYSTAQAFKVRPASCELGVP